MKCGKIPLGAAILCAGFTPYGAHSQPVFTYHVSHHQLEPGEGGWDYLTFDQTHGRLFVTRVGGVEVFDANRPQQLRLIGQVPGAPGIGVNRAVLAEDRDLGFTSNAAAASTTIFRLSDLAIRGTFSLGESTDAAVYDDRSGDAVFFSQAGLNALIYDPVNLRVVGTVPLGSSPEFAVDDHRGSIYVNLPALSEIAKIDVASRSIVTTFHVDPSCQSNMSIDLDPVHHLLFVGCMNGVLDVLDNRTGTTMSTFAAGFVVDAVEYDAGINTLFASSVAGAITAVAVQSTTSQTLLGSVPVAMGARTLTVDLRTHRVFTDAAETVRPPKDYPIPIPVPGTFQIYTVSP